VAPSFSATILRALTAAPFDSWRALPYQLKKGAVAAALDGGQAEAITGTVGAADVSELPDRDALDPLNPGGSGYNRASLCLSKLPPHRGKEILGAKDGGPARQAVRARRIAPSLTHRPLHYAFAMPGTARRARNEGGTS
jgi:hypothetical protein